MKCDGQAAGISEQTVAQVFTRVNVLGGKILSRVVVITLDNDGCTVNMYSNARSDAEMMGMLYYALFGDEKEAVKKRTAKNK